MRKEDTHIVARRHSLPSRETSKAILKAITSGRSEDWKSICPEHHRKLAKIAADYQERRAALNGSYPANWPFYLMLLEKYPGFRLHETPSQLQVEAYFRGTKLNLLSLLLGLVPASEVTWAAGTRKAAPVPEADAVLPDVCTEVFQKERVDLLTSVNASRIARWIERGRMGAAVTLVSPVCPDYATEGTPTGGYRYTFEGLNGGIGATARRVYESAPSLHALFRGRLGIRNLKHLMCVGDFEGFSEDNVRKMGTTEEEFASRMRQSVHALRQEAPVASNACLFSMLCAGKPGWQREIHEMQRRFAAGEFSGLLDAQISGVIAAERASLYRRWFGRRNLESSFVEALVTYQCAEYATVGKISAERCANAMMLGAGNRTLARFYSAAVDTPVLELMPDRVSREAEATAVQRECLASGA